MWIRVVRVLPIPLIALTLILSTSASVFAQEWIEYSNREDFFGVTFPSEPNVKEITYETDYSIVLPGRVYTAETGSEHYSVTVVDYTQARKKHAELVKKCQAAVANSNLCADRTAIDLRSAINSATWSLMKTSSKITHFGFTQSDRVEGNEVYLANPDGSRTFAAIYMHEDRLYIQEGSAPATSPPPVLFQQSMRFLDKDGKVVRYESVYSNGFPPPRREQ